jgi:hypothetical protein
VRTLLAVVVLVLAVAGSSAAAAHRSSVGVSNIKILPSPFYADEPVMKVRFRTSSAAPAHKLFFAVWYSTSTADQSDCNPASRITDPKGAKGGVNLTITLNLTPEPLFDPRFCPGPGYVRIYTQVAGSNGRPAPNATKRTVTVLATYNFRVLRP